MTLTRRQSDLIHSHLESVIRGDSAPSVRDEKTSELLAAFAGFGELQPLELQRLGNRALLLMHKRLTNSLKAEVTALNLFGKLQR